MGIAARKIDGHKTESSAKAVADMPEMASQAMDSQAVDGQAMDGRAVDGRATTDAGAAPVLDTETPDPNMPLALVMKTVGERHGKAMHKIVAELAKLQFGRGRMNTREYFAMRLYDDALSWEEKKAFVGAQGGRNLHKAINISFDWAGLLCTKLAFNTLMQGYGLPVIKTLGYYHEELNLPGLNMLKSAEDIRAFLKDQSLYPIFAKPSFSSQSLGTIAIEGYDASEDMLFLGDGRSVSSEDFASEVVEHFGSGYIFQERCKPHEDVRRICGNRVATVRVYTIVGENGAEVFRTVWKIPGGDNAVDNFWREGNILAAIDHDTGKIWRAVQGQSIAERELTTHPDSGAQLVGTKVPNYDAVIETALNAARLFKTTPLIGWDIAPTDDGCVIVESNNAPNFEIVQHAERRGVLDERMKSLVEFCQMREEAAKKDLKQKGRAHRKDIRSKVFRPEAQRV